MVGPASCYLGELAGSVQGSVVAEHGETRPVVANSINAQRGTRKHFSPRRTIGRLEVPPELKYSCAS